MFHRDLGEILHDELHWLHVPDRVFFKLARDSSPVSERPCSTIPVGLLCFGRRCWHSATAAFQQPSTSCSTTLPDQ